MIFLDTFDYWKCRICNTLEPHVHQVFNRKYNKWYYEDHGYDSRDEEDHGGETKD